MSDGIIEKCKGILNGCLKIIELGVGEAKTQDQCMKESEEEGAKLGLDPIDFKSKLEDNSTAEIGQKLTECAISATEDAFVTDMENEVNSCLDLITESLSDDDKENAAGIIQEAM